MKKTLLSIGLLSLMVASLTSCGGTSADDTLTVYNWEDYIDIGLDEDGYQDHDSVLDLFQDYYYEQTGRTIHVNYQTFSTCEIMYNQIKLGSIKADLICPSDYMIQKMASEDMLESFDYDSATDSYASLTNYNDYGSPYIKNLFKENNFSSYAVPYFWGTMGFTYDPEKVPEEVVSSWDAEWDARLNKKITIKDSVRDTYFTAVMHVYKDELNTLASQFEQGAITKEEYNSKISEIFNRCDDETLAKCRQALIDLKNNIYGLEVDDGKNEIVKGTYYASLSWSGDAVYSMDQAEEGSNPKYLNYIIPQEGSNVWFDGWCMPKGANKSVASMFVDFLSKPSIAAANMNFTGYTSSIASQDIWDLVNEWYAVEGGEDSEEVDLSYFFGDTLNEGVEAKITVERGRQFDAQYPDENTIARCAIMKDFGTQTEAVYSMWSAFKAEF